MGVDTMEITWLVALGIAVCGVCVGVLSAMFGIGGGVVMVPLIHLVFGQPAAIASGTSLFAILPTSVAGMIARLHDGTVHFKTGLAIGIAGACFSPLGAVAASRLPGIYAMLLTACILLFTAYKMFSRVYKTRPVKVAEGAGGDGGAAGAGQARTEERKAPFAGEEGTRHYVVAALLGSLVGFISGYVGLGGGFIVVPTLQWVFGFKMKEATGTSLVAVAILALPSCITHALLGNVAWVIGLLLVAGSVAGTKLGAYLISRVNDRALTGLFGVLLVVTGVILAVQEFLA